MINNFSCLFQQEHSKELEAKNAEITRLQEKLRERNTKEEFNSPSQRNVSTISSIHAYRQLIFRAFLFNFLCFFILLTMF